MPDRPNILIIMTDQQRFDTIHALGNPYIQTPAQDRLVEEGTSFTSAYCPSPVCVSSRCSFLLGQYPHQTGCCNNGPMPQSRTSMMEMLNEAGYQTHGIGKMHFGPDRQKLWGFESRVFSEEGGGEDEFKRFLEENGYGHVVAPHGERSEYYYLPQPSQLPERLHHTYWMGDKTIEFLDGRDSSRPFFCWTSIIKPHPPFESPVPWYRLYRAAEMPLPFLPPDYEHLYTYWNRLQNRYKYRDQGMDMNLLRTMRSAYFACISFIDYTVGRILKRLEEEGILDDTLVLYTSDHGECLGDYACYGKRSFLDVAARVPLLVRYPKSFPQGLRCEEPASLVDVLPTCLAGAGMEKGTEHPGLNLAHLASGSADREFILGQLSQENSGLYMLLNRDFKYIHSAADRKEFLIRRIPGQLDDRNVAGNPAFNSIVDSFRERLIQQFREDGYEAPLDGNGWKEFPHPKEVPDAPDAGHIFQDGGRVADLFPERYCPRLDTSGRFPYKV